MLPYGSSIISYVSLIAFTYINYSLNKLWRKKCKGISFKAINPNFKRGNNLEKFKTD